MKKLLLVLFSISAWYLAAMYHLFSLLVWALAGLILLLSMLAVSLYLKRKIRIGFSARKGVFYKGLRSEYPLEVKNSGLLPGRIRLRLGLSYPGGAERKEELSLLVCAGEEKRAAGLCAPWCGPLTVSLKRARIFDFFSLFSLKTGMKEMMEAAVLPVPKAMKLSFLPDSGTRSGEEDSVKDLGNGGGEIRQIREYVPGDSSRQIHWKLTARTDAIWMKEREEQREGENFLYLDLFSEKERSRQELDGFYEVLSALVTGIIQNRRWVHVMWEEGDGRREGCDVENVEELEELLLKLYLIEGKPSSDRGRRPGKERGLRLSRDLVLSSEGREVYRFSCQKVAEELERIEFIL